MYVCIFETWNFKIFHITHVVHLAGWHFESSNHIWKMKLWNFRYKTFLNFAFETLKVSKIPVFTALLVLTLPNPGGASMYLALTPPTSAVLVCILPPSPLPAVAVLVMFKSGWKKVEPLVGEVSKCTPAKQLCCNCPCGWIVFPCRKYMITYNNSVILSQGGSAPSDPPNKSASGLPNEHGSINMLLATCTCSIAFLIQYYKVLMLQCYIVMILWYSHIIVIYSHHIIISQYYNIIV